MPADAVIISIGIREFKPVNDRYGMHIGDRVLAEFARRLQEAARPWIAYRDGGDEFVVAARLDGEAAIRALVEPVRLSLELPYEGGIRVGTWAAAAMALSWTACRRTRHRRWTRTVAEQGSRAGAVGACYRAAGVRRPISLKTAPLTRAAPNLDDKAVNSAARLMPTGMPLQRSTSVEILPESDSAARGLTRLPYPVSNARAKSSEGPAWPADSSAVWVRAKARWAASWRTTSRSSARGVQLA
jgi:GGDEF domain-containing protein